MTTVRDTVSDARIAAVIPISQDAIESINHDVHLAFALLARRYNSQVPVNRLHPELLGMVFEYLRQGTRVVDPDESLDQIVFDPYKSLIYAMTVCHKWYIVALEKASLWTDVDYSRGTAGPTCLLQRSGTAPIHLRVILEGSPRDMAPFPEIVRTNAPRLRHLDVCMTGADTMQAIEELLENDMPLLQSLKLADEYYHRNAISRKALGRFPSLRGMMLMGFFWLPPPEAGLFTKLTHLHISMLSDLPVASITALLAATPALEVLELHECTAVSLAELPTGTTTLEHLTHLTIRRMSTRVAEALMPALILPCATAVFLWVDADTDAPPTDALLPQPQHWRDATRVRVDEGPYGSLTVSLEDPGPRRVMLCLEYSTEGEAEAQPLWPLPVPTLARLSHVTAARLSVFAHWGTALPQFAARFPALASLIVEGPLGDQAAAAEMVDALRAVLAADDSEGGGPAASRCAARLKEVALVLPCAVSGLAERLAPALKRRNEDGLQIERLRTWIAHDPGYDEPGETGPRDVGDALAEYVGAGKVEHEEGAFWSRDEKLWRRENEFWEVPRTWW
ncbi:hypothetical protein V8D89_007627 [Ganoderma adspersum]